MMASPFLNITLFSQGKWCLGLLLVRGVHFLLQTQTLASLSVALTSFKTSFQITVRKLG